MATKPSYEELEQMVKELQEESLQRKHAEVELCETTRRLEVSYDQAISYAQGLNDKIAEHGRADEELRKMSEEQALLLDNIDTQIWHLTDLENNGAVNKAHAEFLGVQKSDIAYKNIYDLLSKEEADVCVAGNREVFEKKRRVHTDEWIKNGKGELRLLFISKTPRLDKDGNVEYVVCAAEDITERRRAEDSLRESEEKYRDLVENINDLIFSVDMKGTITYISPVVQRMMGYNPSEVVGRQFKYFVHPEDLSVVTARFQELLAGKIAPNEYRVLTKAGEMRWVRTSSQPVFEGNSVVGVNGVLTDITDRRRAEKALEESEEKFRLLAEQSLLGIVIIQDGLVKYVNEVAAAMTEYSIDEALHWEPNEFGKLFHPDDLDFVMEQAQKKQEGAKDVITHYSYRMKTKSGKVKWVDQYSKTITFGGKSADLITILDITERRRAEERLRASEERFRGLFDQSNDAVFIHSLDGQILDVNRRTCEMLGYERQKLLELSIPELHPEDSLYESRKAFEAAEDTGSVLFESAFKKADGTIIDVEISSRVVDPKEGIVQGIVRDITERKRSEQALRDSESQLRALGSRLSEVEEIERKELARELHDRVGQNLTALGINLNVVNNYLQDEAREKVGSRLDDALKQVEETARDIRDVMSELRPPVLDDYGLMAALRWFCKQFSERTGISVAMQGEELTSRLSIALEIGLFRIAQEALTNVSKHARANHIAVTLDRVAGGVRLVIADDGQGFDAESVRWTSEDQKWGLLTMRERAAAAGGTFHIKSDPGQGTEIVVEVRG